MKEFLDAYNKPDIQSRIKNLKSYKFSDVVDDNNYQYVDLVQEGGGVLGIALVGYTKVLEDVGIRFLGLAGTSAGAINTMMLAALGELDEVKSDKILKVLSEKNLFELVDGDPPIRKIIRKYVNKENWRLLYLVLKAVKLYKTVTRKLGLNPGKDFTSWIDKVLGDAGIGSLDVLTTLRKRMPAGLRCLTNPSLVISEAKLCVITSDVTTHSKVSFPQMVDLYWKADGDGKRSVKPSDIVRASMSIPIFFEPFEVHNIPGAGNDAAETAAQKVKWEEYASYTGPIPKSVKFVDGGLLSNFPINVFHRTDGKPPTRPTFGVRLSTYRSSFANTDTLLRFGGAMISTMRQIHDYDFLMRNPDYKHLICRIDADGEFNWLDFDMKRDEQVNLFMMGVRKALDFLEGFKWDEYKKLRTSMAVKGTISARIENKSEYSTVEFILDDEIIQRMNNGVASVTFNNVSLGKHTIDLTARKDGTKIKLTKDVDVVDEDAEVVFPLP